MNNLDIVIAEIEKQQQGKEQTAPWMVGEQLKDIARREPISAELLAKDLTVSGMGIADAEKKIKAWADKHKKGSCAVVPPNVAEDILREFYGLPKGEAPREEKSGILNLSDFF
ncbi:MAG: hypothetical protein IKM48_08585 [Clostridia bacterium]|nr:hypothetical protein [Clostridia bacterium]